MSIPTKPLTNTFLLRRNSVTNQLEVLLGKKKRGWMVGIWNGFGGKVENGETIEQGAIRELKEECNVDGEDLTRIGLFFQTFESKPDAKLEIHIFVCEKWSGEITETDEMMPKWFNASEVPMDEMWGDDGIWFPYMLKKSFFKGICHFQTDKPDAMLSHSFEEISKEELAAFVAKEASDPSKE